MKYGYEIMPDNDPQNPRRDYDPISTMVCFWANYDLGDKHDFQDGQALVDYLEENKDSIVSLPLFIYEHGGITMSTGDFNDDYDSGQAGYIYMTIDKAKEELGNPDNLPWKERIAQHLKSEVSEYAHYLEGEVYGYRVFELNEDGDEGDEVDSCWGFCGHDYCEEEAKSVMKYYTDKQIKGGFLQYAQVNT